MLQLTSMTFFINFVALMHLVTLVLAQEPGCTRNYIVQPGDVCNSISAAQNVSTFQLAHLNPKINDACTDLFAGESLCLGVKGQDCNVTTVLRTGDTCEGISIKAGITLSLLLKNNPNINSTCGNIYPGEVLCTADHVFVLSPRQ